MKIFEGQKFYLYGIKGAGMSALAQILHKLGADVRGCDVSDYYFTEQNLNKYNLQIDNIKSDITYGERKIIVGNAFWDKFDKTLNPIQYTDFLRELENILQSQGVTTIAIAGTHGKTTTTKMLVDCLDNVIGLIGDGNGIVKGIPTFFVYEACEYRSNFMKYKPNIAVITNIEFDHPDYFENLQSTIAEFSQFTNKVSDVVLLNNSDANSQKLLEITQTKAKIIKYPISNVQKYQLPFSGEHMIKNFQSIEWILNLVYSENESEIQRAINGFKAPHRRYEISSLPHDNILIDDYAHHPTEIEATFQRIKTDWPMHKKVIIFQPHTFSRTISLMDSFSHALSNFDEVYLMPIFSSARETEGQITSEDFIDKLSLGQMWDESQISTLKSRNEQVILICGAGNIDELLKNKIIERMN